MNREEIKALVERNSGLISFKPLVLPTSKEIKRAAKKSVEKACVEFVRKRIRKSTITRRSITFDEIPVEIPLGRFSIPEEFQKICFLTDREMAIFNLFGQGLETREVASRNEVSRKTIEAQLATMRKKLKLPSLLATRVLSTRWQVFKEKNKVTIVKIENPIRYRFEIQNTP